MAIYHFSVKIIKRSEGRSAVAAAAYRSGTKLTNEWDGITHDYTKKHWIEHSEIFLPAQAKNVLGNAQRSGTVLNQSRNLAMLSLHVSLKLPFRLSFQRKNAIIWYRSLFKRIWWNVECVWILLSIIRP